MRSKLTPTSRCSVLFEGCSVRFGVSFVEGGDATVDQDSTPVKRAQDGGGPEAERLTLHDLFTPDELSGADNQALQAAAQALSGPVAPIELPADSAMAVRVVPLAILQHFEDLRSDAALFHNMAYLFVGALLSWMVSIVAAVDPRPFALAVGACLVCVASVFIALAWRSTRRVAKLRAAALETSKR